MESFFVAMLVVAVGEIGDKTQLLALVLVTRFRRPVPIIFGIFVATIANHAEAGAVGELIKNALEPGTLRILLADSFFAIALWAIKTDTMENKPRDLRRDGVFAFTDVVFFLVEICVKTHPLTVAPPARSDPLLI